MTAMDSSPVYPRKLQVAVWAAIFILTMGFAAFLSHFFTSHNWMMPVFFCGGVAVFVAGLCGTFCGLPLVFRLHGFPRLVAVLAALVSLYAVIFCAGFLRAAIGM